MCQFAAQIKAKSEGAIGRETERVVYCLLSSNSLAYSKICLSSLLQRALEPIQLTLITDTDADRSALKDALDEPCHANTRLVAIRTKADLDGVAHDRLSKFPHVLAFREGHPCWRKVTDAALLAELNRTEVILIDPDVYFPNYFCFEPAPAVGVYLMWQKANCLHPPEVVRRAFDVGVPLADHTDIGVCQFAAPLDWEWIGWFLGQLGGADIPHSMHVESIVWAALAMRGGGGYLCPRYWRCWNHSIVRRLQLRTITGAATLLRKLDLSDCKCLHAGGRIKWSLEAAYGDRSARGAISLGRSSPILEFSEFERGAHCRKTAIRTAARALGVYRLIGEN